MLALRYCVMLICGLLLIHKHQSDAFGQTVEKTEPAAEAVTTARMVYKQEPRRSLTVFYPDGWKASDRRPALVILRCNIPVQREHFRQRGMVIIKPQIASVNHGRLPGSSLEEIAKMPRPRHQVEDTKSVIRYLRENADQLGIDPDRIVATGTSGGGDLALQSAINTAFDDRQDDLSISPRPDALVLYCPAFDGIDIWFVRTETLLGRTKAEAPSYLPLLPQFIRSTKDEYALPLNHRADLIMLAASLGKEKGLEESEIKAFQNILGIFNKSDWQLLHPVEDARRMSASRILTEKLLPPTLIMFGTRDHLHQYQTAFVKTARERGQKFDLKIFEGGGHSFMMQPPFREPSTQEAEKFLRKIGFLPVTAASKTGD